MITFKHLNKEQRTYILVGAIILIIVSALAVGSNTKNLLSGKNIRI